MEYGTLDVLTSDLKRRIGRGEIGDVLDQLEGYLRGNAPAAYNDVLAQSARFHAAARRYLAGEIGHENYVVEENRIRKWLLVFIDGLPTKVERRYVPLERASDPAMLASSRANAVGPEKILGLNNLKQISWLETGLRFARSVCRILTPNGLGTGFVVAPNLIMTNNHVLASADEAAGTIAEFDYQQDGDGNLLPTVRYELDRNVFKSSKGLDYTLVGVKGNPAKPSLEHWGCVRLNPHADPLRTEHVSIIQHPNGGLKQIVLTANWVVDVVPPLLHYTTDTMPGSSGSPVFNDSWHVIAIHHASAVIGGDKPQYVNEGVLMSAIRADAGAAWPGGGE